jgi:hypothetical protein
MCGGLNPAGRDEEIAAGVGALNNVGENLLSLFLERTILFNKGARPWTPLGKFLIGLAANKCTAHTQITDSTHLWIY